MVIRLLGYPLFSQSFCLHDLHGTNQLLIIKQKFFFKNFSFMHSRVTKCILGDSSFQISFNLIITPHAKMLYMSNDSERFDFYLFPIRY